MGQYLATETNVLLLSRMLLTPSSKRRPPSFVILSEASASFNELKRSRRTSNLGVERRRAVDAGAVAPSN